MNEKEIVKKVLSGRLTGEEKKNISERDIIVRHLKSQWNDTRDDSTFDVEAKNVYMAG